MALMIFILLVLQFLFFIPKVWATEFEYQFNLSGNFIYLDFFKKIEVPSPTFIQPVVVFSPTLTLTPSPIPPSPPTPTPTTMIKKKILAFDYKLEATQTLPEDLPLFIVAFEQQVVFSANASTADSMLHHIELDIESLNPLYLERLPIFYQNNYVQDFKLQVNNLTYLENFTNPPTVSNAKIKDVNLIRESDQSLTLIFSLNEEVKKTDSYFLICTDENQKLLNKVQLIRTDDFLWSNFDFSNFNSNQKGDLIFHLAEFPCAGMINVASGNGDQFAISSIIEVESL